MASVVNEYLVNYHFEVSGKKSGPECSDFVQAAASDYNTIKNVLSSNGKLKSGTLVLDSVRLVSHSDKAIA